MIIGLDTLKNEYEVEIKKFERLRTIVFGLVSTALSLKSMNILQVQSRIKSKASFSEKVDRKSYDDPYLEMTDIVGIRVITFLESDVKIVEDILRDYFAVDEANSINKSSERAIDQVGYGSSHLVCSLGDSRAQLPECEGISDIAFEIQIRTALQHAWAEIEHKQNYKAERALPAELMRRLNIAAGTLEGLDAEFSRIVYEAKRYADHLSSGDNVESNDVLNIALLKHIMPSVIDHFDLRDLPYEEDALKRFEVILNELGRFDINSVGDLMSLIERVNKDAVAKALVAHGRVRPVGLLRYIMYADNFEGYLERAFTRSYTRMNEVSVNLIKETNIDVDLDALCEKYALSIP